MIVYKSRYLTRGEVWFDDPPGGQAVDWVLYHQTPQPIARTKWREFYTRIIDLTQPRDILLSQMKKSTSAAITKAVDKDKVFCEQLDPQDERVVSGFLEVHDGFAEQRGLNKLDRGWLMQTIAADALDIFVVKSPDNEPLVYNTLYRNSYRVRGMYRASLHRSMPDSSRKQMLGRASRLLTWHAMLHYKDIGISVYDLGGWYNGTADPARLGINEFKQSFGGRVVREFECENILTLKGLIVLRVAQFLETAKAARTRSSAGSGDAAVPETSTAERAPVASSC